MKKATTTEIARETRQSPQLALINTGPDWREHWAGMPEFTMADATAIKKVTISFMTMADIDKFCKATGCKITSNTDSAWYPPMASLSPGKNYYSGPATPTRYPVCIPSKGRADCQTTGKLLTRMGVPHKFFVEDTEADEYIRHVGADRVVVMPFHDLCQGSIPARNFIWEWAKERGHKRHWVIDDNITGFVRQNINRRLNVYGGGYFRAMEDFADRYKNIAFAGPHGKGFANDRSAAEPAFILNSRVYSCTLINTDLPYRWRGRYNEDTDICLRALKDGWCTILFKAMLMQKAVTSGAKGVAMKGGNTDNVYNTGDHRLAFAQSLKDQHPDCVDVVWKFNRWHHQVDYSRFKNNKPVFVDGYVPRAEVNNYGMELMREDENETAPQ